MSRHEVTLLVNGDRHRLTVEARRTLADVLRDRLRLTGTHLGCEQGVCGACTVLVDGEPVRACLALAVQCDGASVRTVEGLTAAMDAGVTDADALHPLQCLLGEEGGVQCGFCTPGFLMLLTGVLEERPDLDDEALAVALSSNLCRCTGYRPIAVAARRARDLYTALAAGDAPDTSRDDAPEDPSNVTNRLAREFGTNLESTLAAAAGPSRSGEAPSATPPAGAAPLDLGRLAFPTLKPVLAALGALVTGAVAFALARRRRR